MLVGVFNGFGLRSAAAYVGRILQVESPIRDVEDMAAPVARFAGAELPPEAPIIRRELVGVRTRWAGSRARDPNQGPRADPWAVPDHRACRACPPIQECTSVISPRMPDLTSSDALAKAGVGVALVAELRGEFLFGCELGQGAHFPDIVSQRFFQINVLAAGQRAVCRMKVHMVGCADRDGVDFLFELVVHLAEVGELLGLGVVFPMLARRASHRHRTWRQDCVT